MDGKYDKIVGGNIHRQGAQKTLCPHVALRLMKVIVRNSGGCRARTSQKPRAAKRPNNGRPQPKAKDKAKVLAAQALARKALPAVVARARALADKARRGGRAPMKAKASGYGGRAPTKAKALFELGPPGPDPQKRQTQTRSAFVP